MRAAMGFRDTQVGQQLGDHPILFGTRIDGVTESQREG
jgi:hypothetical protein